MGIKVIGGTNPQTVINSFDTVQYFIDLDTDVVDRSQSFSPDDDFEVTGDNAHRLRCIQQRSLITQSITVSRPPRS